MKKFLSALFIFCVLSFACSGQNHNRERMWVLPDSAGINFNTVTPTVFFTNLSGCLSSGDGTQCEADASISDMNGNLLFYSNGRKIYDRNNNLMLNGDSIWCGISTTNGITIIPYPEHDSLYFAFYVNSFSFYHPSGVYYSVINMNKNGGLGDLETNEKNILAFGLDSMAESIAAVKHANGRDWWLIGKRASGYFKILVTPDGIANTSFQQIGWGSTTGWSAGEISVSRNGEKIASSLNAIALLEQMNFDRCSGQLSNLVFHNFFFSITTYLYGCCFSPSGNNIYCSLPDTLYQLINSGTSLDITFKVANTNLSGFYAFSQLELGPDNVIYFPNCYANNPSFPYSSTNMNLCTINSPDSLGSLCDVQLSNFNLGGKRTSFGLPNMPNYDLGRLVDSPCDTLPNSATVTENKRSIVRIFPNPASDELTIEVLNGIAPNKIEIINSMGQVAIKLKQTKPNQQVNLKSLPSGIYFIKITFADGETEIKKMVKE